eukprot:GHVH01014800.1.p1 GENE.GHVH01014800.1~~GHVH01014800.1.p1  ORF type:complete len:122 (+),score=18.80 GHVH01014800.1:141-506(+)
MAEGLKSLKQKLVKDENTVTTLDSIGWYYKVGTFSIELEIVANGIKDTKQRYVTVTTADQIFVSSCHEHKNRYTAESIKGVLYDKCFPKMLNVRPLPNEMARTPDKSPRLFRSFSMMRSIY